MTEQISKKEQIALPERLVSSVDLSRVIREILALDESLRQMELRKPGEPTKLARSSVTLEELARLNNVSLTDKVQREQLIDMLKGFQEHAPRLHMSMAVEPSAGFVHKMIVWMRANLHPVVLLEIGLQPTLAAGCMVRTNNKIFDMSLRHRFTENRGMLVTKIGEAGKKAEEQNAKTAPSRPAPAPDSAPAPEAAQ